MLCVCVCVCACLGLDYPSHHEWGNDACWIWCSSVAAMRVPGCDTRWARKNSSSSETQPADTARPSQPERDRAEALPRGAQVIPISSNIRMFLHRHGSTAHMCLVPACSKKEAFQAPSTQPCQTQQPLLETTWHRPTSLLWAACWKSMCVRKPEGTSGCYLQQFNTNLQLKYVLINQYM